MIEKKVRSFLLKSIGYQGYLSLVSDIYIRLIRAGLMKKKYPELFYLGKIINPGFVCIDIGANVGYYSVFLSQLAGKTGRIYSVEPVPLFANVFLKNARKFAQKNITLYQTALGAENKTITMATPFVEGVFRHGLTKVVEEKTAESARTYDVMMRVPDELFSFLDKLDFLKCDVEGYEVHLFPHFIETLKRLKPLIQIELSGTESRTRIISLLQPLGYAPYKLQEGKLEKMQHADAVKYEDGDFYFKVAF